MTVLRLFGGLAIVLLLGAVAGFLLDRDPNLDRGARAFGVTVSLALAGLLGWWIWRA